MGGVDGVLHLHALEQVCRGTCLRQTHKLEMNRLAANLHVPAVGHDEPVKAQLEEVGRKHGVRTSRSHKELMP